MFMTLDAQIHHCAQSELIQGRDFNQRLQVNCELLSSRYSNKPPIGFQTKFS